MATDCGYQVIRSTGPLDCCPTPTAVPPVFSSAKMKKLVTEACVKQDPNKGQTTMATTETDLKSSQIRHLSTRLYEAKQEKKAALKLQFLIDDDTPPRTFEELMARITAKQYVIDEKDAKKTSWNGGLAFVTWRDPAKPADQAGYDAAKAILNTKYQAASDIITVSDPAIGLKALQEFQAA